MDNAHNMPASEVIERECLWCGEPVRLPAETWRSDPRYVRNDDLDIKGAYCGEDCATSDANVYRVAVSSLDRAAAQMGARRA